MSGTTRQALVTKYIENGLSGASSTSGKPAVDPLTAAVARSLRGARVLLAQKAVLRTAMGLTHLMEGDDHERIVPDLMARMRADPADESAQVELALRLPHLPRGSVRDQILARFSASMGCAPWLVAWAYECKLPAGDGSVARWPALRVDLREGSSMGTYHAVLDHLAGWLAAGHVVEANQLCHDLVDAPRLHGVLAGAVCAIVRPYRAQVPAYDALEARTHAQCDAVPAAVARPAPKPGESLRTHLLRTPTLADDLPMLQYLAEGYADRYADTGGPEDPLALGKARCCVAIVRGHDHARDYEWCLEVGARLDAAQAAWTAKHHAAYTAKRDAAWQADWAAAATSGNAAAQRALTAQREEYARDEARYQAEMADDEPDQTGSEDGEPPADGEFDDVDVDDYGERIAPPLATQPAIDIADIARRLREGAEAGKKIGLRGSGPRALPDDD